MSEIVQPLRFCIARSVSQPR